MSERQVAAKMEAIGRLAGGVARDFNNVLTVILSCTDLLSRSRGAAASEGYAAEIASAAERGVALTRQLMTLSSLQPVQARAMDLNAVVVEAQAMLRRLISEQITLAIELDPQARYVRADPGQIEQVILNLVLNARDAIGERGGRILVATRRNVAHVAEVALCVEDNGAGMSDAVKAHLFEPFFTTKPRGQGTGLGLATVYGIVQQTSGHVNVRSVLGEGTTIEVLLPATDEAAGVRAPSSRPAGRSRGEETVLLVEDEAPLRRVIREVLTDSGYEVIEASDGHEAMRAIARRAEEGLPIDLVLSDVVMPGPSGRQLAATVREGWPDARVLIMSGWDAETATTTNGDADPVLEKPFTAASLSRRVREVLDGAAPGSGGTASPRGARLGLHRT